MKNGILIYYQDDYTKNQVYAKMLIDYHKTYDLNLTLVILENLAVGVINNRCEIFLNNDILINVDFVINRTRESWVSEHFELKGVRVFNSKNVTLICNNKFRTHQFISKLNIEQLSTISVLLNQIENFIPQIGFPFVIKEVSGHGGEQVYKIEDLEQLSNLTISNTQLIMQPFLPCIADVRVFILGNNILGAVKRNITTNFKANYTLGATIEPYNLTNEQKNIVLQIVSALQPDFVGIDFLLTSENKFIFNEIEDAVGSRMLYNCTDIDSALCFSDYIQKQLL